MIPLRSVRWFLWACVAVCSGALAYAYFSAAPLPAPGSRNRFGAPLSDIGGAFTLTDHRGQIVTEQDFRGRPAAVFFGFTSCPEVCPTTLWTLSELLRSMGRDARDMQVLFISIDPERDAPAKLKDYVSNFDRRVTGLTGTSVQIAAVAAAYKAYLRKVPRPDGDYTMDHAATVYLMDRAGKFRGTIDRHEPQDVSLAKLRMLIEEPAPSESRR